MLQIESDRLRLVPCSVAVAQAAIADRAQLAAALGIRVPDDWPAEDLRDFLPASGQTLIGDIGFKGPPDATGAVEIGYSVLPAFRRRGYATEAARALVGWAAAQPGVRRVTAECLADNSASIRVLEKAGLRQVGRDEHGLKWVVAVEK